MNFWDASAVVPLLVEERSREAMLTLVDQDPVMLVWWSTPVECASAIARRERDESLSVSDAGAALDRLRTLTSQWQEVLPSDAVRSVAQRILRVHPLRGADSLQLAAAIIAAEREPETLAFVSLDARMNDVAAREGFRVLSG